MVIDLATFNFAGTSGSGGGGGMSAAQEEVIARALNDLNDRLETVENNNQNNG